MKKAIVLLFLSVMYLKAFSQNENDQLLRSYIQKVMEYNGFSMEVRYCKKELFDTDTICNIVDIKYKKSIPDKKKSFLQIVDRSTFSELLLLNDTSWSINHHLKEIQHIGGKKEMAGNGLFAYFPLNSLLMDSSIFQKERYWSYLESEGAYQPIKFGLSTSDKEITSVEMILYIDTLSQLCVKQSIEADFGQIGFQFQEQTISNLHNFDSVVHEKPLYFRTYEVFFQLEDDTAQNKLRNTEITSIRIDTMEFTMLEGGSFTLPENEFIFLDFWYVGCFHCVKAAPIIDTIYKQYGDKLRFFSVNDIDCDMKKILKFKDRMDINMPVLLYKRNVFSTLLQNNGYPRFLLIDTKTGNILWKFFGEYDGLKNEIEIAIKKIIL